MVALWAYLTKRRAPGHDPMQTLELQLRLSRVLRELQRAENHRGFAAAHHARAARIAYEVTLRAALRLADGTECDVMAGDVIGLELELAARGWRW